MVVRHELVQGAEQPALSEQDEAIETLLPDRAHEALRKGVLQSRQLQLIR